jgi:hypothetical protein
MVCSNDQLLSDDNNLLATGYSIETRRSPKGGVRSIRTWIFVTFLFKATDILATVIRLDRSST